MKAKVNNPQATKIITSVQLLVKDAAKASGFIQDITAMRAAEQNIASQLYVILHNLDFILRNRQMLAVEHASLVNSIEEYEQGRKDDRATEPEYHSISSDDEGPHTS